MFTLVTIEWDEPKEKGWLCADNIAIALRAYCPNTRFNVSEMDPNEPDWKVLCEEMARDLSDIIFSNRFSDMHDTAKKLIQKYNDMVMVK